MASLFKTHFKRKKKKKKNNTSLRGTTIDKYDPDYFYNDDTYKNTNSKKKKGRKLGTIFNKNENKKPKKTSRKKQPKYEIYTSTDQVNKALNKAQKRRAQLATIQHKSDKMVNTSKEYNNLAKQLE
eukprot:757583_1